jgi:hypothetical protein
MYTTMKACYVSRVRVSAWALAIAIVVGSRAAKAQCAPGDALLSEARAARWLVADDILANASLDHERFTRPSHEVIPKLTALTFAGVSFQSVGSRACTNRGVEDATLQRLRLWAGIGLTHNPTGLEMRFSVMHGRDGLNVDISPSANDSAEAATGYSQTMLALRFGHEKWLRGLVGFVDPDTGFNRPDGGVTIYAPLAVDRSAPSTYLGASIPLLGVHVVSLFRSGVPEFVNLSSQERRIGTLPISVSFFPTYIREERRVFGTARVHWFAPPGTWRTRDDNGNALYLENTRGATLEAAVEARDARLRQLRLRAGSALGDRTVAHAHMDASAYVEGTVFRSAFFSNAKILGTESTRGTAWGGGVGGNVIFHGPSIGLVMDVNAAFNRPELLQILPSAQNEFEFRGALSLRAETD